MSVAVRIVTQQQTLSALHYPHAEPPAPGQTIEVAPGLYWLRMPLPWALDHVNAWLLRDGEGWIAVDTGCGSDETRALWERVFDSALEGLPIKSVIVTHFHPDHVGLASWLTERFGANFWMTAAEYLTGQALLQNLSLYSNEAIGEMFRRHGLDDAHLSSLINRDETYRRNVADLPPSFRRLKNGDQIDIDGRIWRVMVGYGHAPEHASLYCASNNILIAGDMVLPRISPNVSVWPAEQDGDPLRLFLESLECFAELPRETLVLPSHGKVFRGLHARLRQLQEHHRDRFDELLAFCAVPRTSAEAVSVLFQRALDDHQWFFAMGEAIAHLNYLLARKKLRRDEGADGVYRFTRAEMAL